jgi:hypothetical protein
MVDSVPASLPGGWLAYADCASSFSNILCAVPDNPSVIGADYAADAIGHCVTSCKGKNKVTAFEPTKILSLGDAV